MNVGQDVRHLRRADCGVGRIEDIYPDGTCKAVFPGCVFTGGSTTLFEPVCLESIRKEKQEEARRKEAELEAAWERKQKQAEEDRKRRRESAQVHWSRCRNARTERQFKGEEQRLLKQLDALLDQAQRKETIPVKTAGADWRHQALKRDGAATQFPPIEARVVGVTSEGRQGVIAEMEECEQVLLVREPENPFDLNAISVQRPMAARSATCAANLRPGWLPAWMPTASRSWPWSRTSWAETTSTGTSECASGSVCRNVSSWDTA